MDRPPCNYYKKGLCNEGKDCDFWHAPLCRNFKKGNCQDTKCFFLPGEIPQVNANVNQEQLPKDNPGNNPRAKSKGKKPPSAGVAVAMPATSLTTKKVTWPLRIIKIAAKQAQRPGYTMQPKQANPQRKQRNLPEEIAEMERLARVHAKKLQEELNPKAH